MTRKILLSNCGVTKVHLDLCTGQFLTTVDTILYNVAYLFTILQRFDWITPMTDLLKCGKSLIFMPDKPGQMGLFFYTLADSKDRYHQEFRILQLYNYRT